MAAAVLSSVAVTGCLEKKAEVREADAETTAQSAEMPELIKTLSEDERKSIEGKTAVVILGHGYNEGAAREEIISRLDESFGTESEGKEGLVMVLTFPDDFNSKITTLESKIKEKSPLLIVIIGAPERTHRALSAIQDKFEDGNTGYPIYSFFPQDDILGTQSTADLVLDYAHKPENIEDTLGADETASQEIDVAKMVESAIFLAIKNGGAGNIQTTAQEIAGAERTISPYVDSETGLHSKNHFTFE